MKLIITLLNSKYTAISWTVLIFILCTLPSEHLPKNNDKMSHFIAFAGLSFFWFFQSSKYLIIILLSAFYGIAIEFWQRILPQSFHRSFDWFDALADAMGSLIGYVIWVIFQRLFNR